MLQSILAFVAALPVSAALKSSQLAYPVVNTVHILGLAVLFGAILSLDLRLLGVFASVHARPLAVILPRIAACGLAIAVLTGLLLFTVDPFEYAANTAFLVKVTLVLAGSAHALWVHASPGWRGFMDGTGTEIGSGLKLSAGVSLVIWTAAIFAGRFIAF